MTRTDLNKLSKIYLENRLSPYEGAPEPKNPHEDLYEDHFAIDVDDLIREYGVRFSLMSFPKDDFVSEVAALYKNVVNGSAYKTSRDIEEDIAIDIHNLLDQYRARFPKANSNFTKEDFVSQIAALFKHAKSKA
jgi:hypothetical protein